MYLIKNPQRKRGEWGREKEVERKKEKEGGEERERRELFIVFAVKTLTLPPLPPFFSSR